MTDKEREQYISHRINSAKTTFKAAKSLIDNGFYNSAVNRLYYSIFYAVNALLVKNKITARTHSGIKQQFSLHFIKNNKMDTKYGELLARLFFLRQKADYDNIFEITDEDVVSLLIPVKNMINEIEKLITN